MNDPDVDLDKGYRTKKRYNPKRTHCILKEQKTVFVTLDKEKNNHPKTYCSLFGKRFSLASGRLAGSMLSEQITKVVLLSQLQRVFSPQE